MPKGKNGKCNVLLIKKVYIIISVNCFYLKITLWRVNTLHTVLSKFFKNLRLDQVDH